MEIPDEGGDVLPQLTLGFHCAPFKRGSIPGNPAPAQLDAFPMEAKIWFSVQILGLCESVERQAKPTNTHRRLP